MGYKLNLIPSENRSKHINGRRLKYKMYFPKPIHNNIRVALQNDGLYEISYEAAFHIENGIERIGTVTIPNLKVDFSKTGLSVNSLYGFEQTENTETIFTITLDE